MNYQAELSDFRMKLYWYAGLLSLPLLVILILANADPQKNLRVNEVIELRQQLNKAGIGQDVIAYLDKVGGKNISEYELQRLKQAKGSDLFFMLSSAKYSDKLKSNLQESYQDGYITRAEAERYQQLAVVELSQQQVLEQFGL